MVMFEFVEENVDLAQIKVVGVGGAGGNAVNRMIEADLQGVEFLAINTDLQALRASEAHQKLQIGHQLTRGLGSGGDPNIGRLAVEEDEETVTDHLHGSDMVFVTAGMGGGTGTGAAPFVAKVAREMDALTVGIVTKPFLFEGAVRMRQAEEGIAALEEAVDTLIVIPNERLLEVVPPNTSIKEAFRFADNILYEATRGIYEIISRPNLVNLDFADVRACMKDMGVALMGTGRAEGENRAVAAAEQAISSPLLENVDIAGAKAVLVNLLAADLQIAEISAAMSHIQNAAGSQAHIMFGYGTDESLGETLQVTVIATGFGVGGRKERHVPARESARAPVAAVVEDVAAAPAARRAESGLEPEAAPEVETEPVGEPAFETEPVASRPAVPEPDRTSVAEPVPEPDREPVPEPAREERALAAADGEAVTRWVYVRRPEPAGPSPANDGPTPLQETAEPPAPLPVAECAEPAADRRNEQAPETPPPPAPDRSLAREVHDPAPAHAACDHLDRACREAAVAREDGLEMIVPEGMSPVERHYREGARLADELQPVPVRSLRRDHEPAASVERDREGWQPRREETTDRRTQRGFLTDGLGGDLEAPAYTRKYLD
jgi:cell division protein FtsZ